MESIWKLYPKVDAAVRESHETAGGPMGHHDIHHARRVGEMAQTIAYDEYQNLDVALKAGVAGLCHNADRILQVKLGMGRQEAPKEQVEALICDWLQAAHLECLQATVVHAVMNHDGKNNPIDPPELVALRDADRVVNLDADVIMRSAQHFHDLPTVDYEYWLNDPEASFRKPKTVLFDINLVREWVDPTQAEFCMRTSLGRKLGRERSQFLDHYFETLQAQLTQESYLPYPFAKLAT